jgi:hypothetical protein
VQYGTSQTDCAVSIALLRTQIERNGPHQHGQDVRVVSTDKTLRIELVEIAFSTRINRVIDSSLKR